MTEALKSLRQRKLTSYRRGEITINDRKGMERVAGEARHSQIRVSETYRLRGLARAAG